MFILSLVLCGLSIALSACGGQQAEPCETCLRWDECLGVDADFCPLCNGEG